MKARLVFIHTNAKVGYLEVKRTKGWVLQACIHNTTEQCGEWCPAFLTMKKWVTLGCCDDVSHELVEIFSGY